MATPPFRVLVLCTGNSARSQIAEALLAALGAGRIAAASAGSRPAPCVHPDAIAVLRARGFAWEGRTPRGIDAVIDTPFDLVITVCDDAREACPYLPGAHTRVHWGMPDPAAVSDPAERRAAFERTYEALARRIAALLDLPLESLPPGALAERAAALASA